MYFAGVNRGVSFTKAGFYTTGLVLLLGFVATGSGYNGLFVAVGYGLSVLTISGLLSERIMKHYEFVGLRETRADAGEPFTIPMAVRNKSDSWHCFGMENLVLDRTPRFRLMPSTLPSLMEGRLLLVAPGESAEIPGRCSGLPRGVHRKFQVVQRTVYPFGLLTKFKVSPATTRITVLPRFDGALARKLTAEARSRVLAHLSDPDFHSHRRLTTRDSLRLVDWKKSAGRDPADWTVKVYESPARDFGVLVSVDWAALAASPSEAEYEAALSAARTACDVVRDIGRKLVLAAPAGGVITGHDACVDALAGAPAFASRAELPRLLAGSPPAPGWYLELVLSGAAPRWKASPVRLGEGGR